MKDIEGGNAKFSLLNFLRLFTHNSFTDMRIAHGEGVLFDKWPEILRFRFNQFWGTYQGSKYTPDEIEHLRRRLYYPVSKADQAKGSGEWRDVIDYSAWS